MTKIYSYELSQEGLTKFKKDIYKIIDIVNSDGFKQYLGERLMEALKFIQRNLLSTINDDIAEEMSIYMNSNHIEIENDTVYIYNDATIDITSKNMKETTKARYPAQLSLAKIVEYGIGYIGGSFTPHQEEVEDWKYDINGHGVRGWFYRDNDGKLHWTSGFAGRMIFYNLSEFVKLNIEDWINKYINDKL